MAHLPKIGLKNFKLFKEKKEFEFRPITLLTGTNSSGKTSVIQALRLLTDYFGNKRIFSDDNLNDYGRLDYIEKLSLEHIGERLGDFSKLFNNTNSSATKKTIDFSIPSSLKGITDSIILTLSISQSPGKLNEGELTGITLYSGKSQKNIFQIVQIKGKWIAKIDYLYFWDEFNRECKQMKKYQDLFAEERELYNNEDNWQLEPDNSRRLKPHIEEKAEQLRKDMDLVHPAFHQQAPYEFTPEDWRATFTPFFRPHSKIPDLKESFFEVSFRNSSDVETQNEQILIYRQKYSLHSEEEFIKLLKTMEQRLLKNFSFTYHPMGIESVLWSVFHAIGDPSNVLDEHDTTEWTSATTALQPLIDLFEIKGLYLKLKGQRNYSLNKLENPSLAQVFFGQFVSQNILSAIQKSADYFSGMSYLPSIRNIVKRAYGNKKDDTVFSGLLLKFLELDIEKSSYIIEFVNHYIKEFEIGDRILIKRDEEGISSRFYIIKNDRKVLLADLGHGISQFIPILINIAIQAQKNEDPINLTTIASTMCIEEPETNLHPALQSKLADLFVDAAKRFKIQFIIETHSEYLIRKLQYLLGKDDPAFSSDQVIIHYFEKEAGKKIDDCIKKIEIKEDGSLSDDFGSGFYDEALHWKFELIRLKNPQKN